MANPSYLTLPWAGLDLSGSAYPGGLSVLASPTISPSSQGSELSMVAGLVSFPVGASHFALPTPVYMNIQKQCSGEGFIYTRGEILVYHGRESMVVGVQAGLPHTSSNQGAENSDQTRSPHLPARLPTCQKFHKIPKQSRQGPIPVFNVPVCGGHLTVAPTITKYSEPHLPWTGLGREELEVGMVVYIDEKENPCCGHCLPALLSSLSALSYLA